MLPAGLNQNTNVINIFTYKSLAYEFNGHVHIIVYSHLLTELYKKSLLYLSNFQFEGWAITRGHFENLIWRSWCPGACHPLILTIVTKHSVMFVDSSNVGCLQEKNVTNITMRDGIFHHTYHDWPSCKSNGEAMVTNNMWYSLKYASIWMMILRNHFHKPPVAEMWLDNKKYDWKFFFFSWFYFQISRISLSH